MITFIIKKGNKNNAIEYLFMKNTTKDFTLTNLTLTIENFPVLMVRYIITIVLSAIMIDTITSVLLRFKLPVKIHNCIKITREFEHHKTN